MPLVERSLRRLQQKSRKPSGEKRVLELLLSGRIERDRPQGLRPLPAVFRRGWNRLVKRAQFRSGRNLIQERRRTLFTGTDRLEPRGCGVPKVSLREPLHRFVVEAARVIR